jgi:TetR/AcrR family transcriptional regulator, ethionamide resistance regulator
MSPRVIQGGPLQATRSADRPRSHGGTSDTELAIFAATERLLAEVPLHELSVAQIISAAEISRATFYFYFSSKYAVVSGLLARVMDEIFDVVQPFVDRRDDVAPAEALRKSLEESIALWQSHRPALRAVHEHWNTTPELQALWIDVVERFKDAVAAEIDRERKAGLAPPGADSRQVAAALLWGTERCLYVAGLGVDRDLPDEKHTLEPLLALWAGALYAGSPATDSGPRRRSQTTARRKASTGK